MPRLVPFLAIALHFCLTGPSFAQTPVDPAAIPVKSRFSGEGGGLRAKASSSKPLFAAWPTERQVKTGRVTIEFEYAAKPSAPALFHRVLLPADAFLWFSSDAAAHQAAQERTAWRKGLLVDGIAWPDSTLRTLSLGHPTHTSIPLVAHPEAGEDMSGRTVITSVQSTTPAALPIRLSDTVAFGAPVQVHVQFSPPPDLPPSPSIWLGGHYR